MANPATSCSTFERADLMRVPSPAARTTERQVRDIVEIRFAKRGEASADRLESWEGFQQPE